MEFRVINSHNGRKVIYEGTDRVAARQARRDEWACDEDAIITIEELHYEFDEETSEPVPVWRINNVI